MLSSQIEGTQATLVDLLNFESGNVQATPDINEVCNYVDAPELRARATCFRARLTTINAFAQ